MKKWIALVLMIAVACCGVCALAENALPAYAYPGNDPVEAAVVGYMLDSGMAELYLQEENSVAIPAPVILKTVDVDETHRTVYGDFWIFNYGLEGTVLHTLSGGETPGVMTLELKDGVWTGTALEAAGDGEDYASDIRRFCAGDEALEALYFEASDAREGRTEETLRRFIREYVEANGLNVTAYQDPGWPPVSLTEGAAE